jgi:hypothetical protein
MKLIAVPMLKEDSWCVRRAFDNQLVACRLTRSEAEARAASSNCLKSADGIKARGTLNTNGESNAADT